MNMNDTFSVNIVETGCVRAEPPYLVIMGPGCPAILFDAWALDRMFAVDQQLFLVVAGTEVTLEIADGFATATSIVEVLAPYTRSARIRDREVLDDAKRRLEMLGMPTIGRQNSSLRRRSLLVGDEVVCVYGEYVCIGKLGFRLDEVHDYADNGYNIPLPSGGGVQAALAILMVAVEERGSLAEDVKLLSIRIRDSEVEEV